jgi:hypothetical protein
MHTYLPEQWHLQRFASRLQLHCWLHRRLLRGTSYSFLFFFFSIIIVVVVLYGNVEFFFFNRYKSLILDRPGRVTECDVRRNSTPIYILDGCRNDSGLGDWRWLSGGHRFVGGVFVVKQ